MANETLATMDVLFAKTYVTAIKAGRPSINPEKLIREMLLQIHFSVD